jgi:hypothetical protein
VKRGLWLLLLLAFVGKAAASDGGLYVAGGSFTFETAVERALAQNPTPRRFFLLTVGSAVRGLSVVAPPELAEPRSNALARGAVFLVCQRDIDKQLYTLLELVPGVVAVRGWPEPGSNALPPGALHYSDEDPASLPAAADALRRLRSTCS